jgi:hypothetical protein
MSTRNLPEAKGRPALFFLWEKNIINTKKLGNAHPRMAHNITTICEPICLENVGASTSHNPMGLHGLLPFYSFTIFGEE